MSNGNGFNGRGLEIAHRLGIWVTVVGLALYVLNMGIWVGAADEKFKSAATVEERQEELKDHLNEIQRSVDLNSAEIYRFKIDIVKAIDRLQKEIEELDNE